VADSLPTDSRLPARLPALDGVRGLAIGLVLTRHLLGQPLDYAGGQPGGWRYDIWYATRLAWTGVDLFFVLSGFLIAKILLENRSSPKLFSTFYSRRALRILPLYYTMLVAMYLLSHLLHAPTPWQWLFGGQHPWWNYATLTQNFPMGRSGITGGNALAVTWSLCIEEQFYLVLPLVIRFTPSRYLPWLFGAALPWAWLARAHWNDGRSYYWAPGHADSLLLGCLLAWICLQPAAFAWLQKQGRGLTLLLALLAAGIFVINQMPEFFGETVPSWFALFFGTLVLLAATQPAHPLTKLLSMRWLRYLGLISYGMYLLHRPIQALLSWKLQGSLPLIRSAHDLYIPVLIFLATLAAASLSWFLYEKKWVKLGHEVRF